MNLRPYAVKLLASSLVFFGCAYAAGGEYHIRVLSEQEIQQTYTQMLRDACLLADRDWHSSPIGPDVGYWGKGVSVEDGGARTDGGMVLACGALLKYDDALSPAERGELLKKTAAALRYVTATHVTGTAKCTDGKSWGATMNFGPGSWQSGMWAGTNAFGAWLIWDKLDPKLQKDIERMVAWEDDVLVRRAPPNGLSLDTKAEENGWEVPGLVLGELMFPDHPHAAAWHETALRYMMNTLCTESDTRDSSIIDGRAVDQWIKGPNLYPDFTLENHNIFHPSYVGCSSYFMTQAMMYYTFAGRAVPETAAHHLLDTWQMFRTILLPWGEAAYPQSMDWELHGLPFINLYAALAARFKDPFAARMEQCNLQYMHTWQEMGHGSLAFFGSPFGFSRHSINAEQVTYGFLAHKIFGPSVEPISWAAANSEEHGVWDRPYVDFIEHRTDKKFVSFSWKNKIMGQVMPIGAGHEGNPEFTTPIQNGLIGSFEPLPPPKASPNVLEHVRKKLADGFETSGTLSLDGGRLKQALKVVSIGEQTVVYEDRVTAVSEVKVTGERGVPVGIENDEFTGRTRTLYSQAGAEEFPWRKSGRAVPILGNWANVDGRLGLVMLAGSGIAYQQATRYTRGMAVCSDILYGSFSNKHRSLKAGEEAAHRVAVLFVEVSPEQTAALAKDCRIETGPQGSVLRFKQPDGKETQVPLF